MILVLSLQPAEIPIRPAWPQCSKPVHLPVLSEKPAPRHSERLCPDQPAFHDLKWPTRRELVLAQFAVRQPATSVSPASHSSTAAPAPKGSLKRVDVFVPVGRYTG